MIETVQYLREIYRVCDQNEVTSQMFDEGLVAFQPMNYSDYRTYMPYPWRVKKFPVLNVNVFHFHHERMGTMYPLSIH